MTLTLDRLQAAGLVRRARNTDDGRRVVIELTPAGTRLARRVNEALYAWESELELPIPAADAVQVLDAVTDAMQAQTR
jgi:DNA-binding MarR family transcriptional regulator